MSSSRPRDHHDDDDDDEISEIWLRYVVNDLKILESSFTMLQMTKEFDKRLTYVGNYVYMWEMA